MKCFRKIEIENWKIISEKLYDFVTGTDILKNKYSWNTVDSTKLIEQIPELQLAFDKFDIIIKMTAVMYRPPLYQGGIHIDSGIGIRALIPIKNCKGSYTKFFEVDKSKITTRYTKDGSLYFHVPPGAVLTEIDSIESIEPFMFNPQIPHGVYTNNSLEPRLTFTIGFDRSPIELLC